MTSRRFLLAKWWLNAQKAARSILMTLTQLLTVACTLMAWRAFGIHLRFAFINRRGFWFLLTRIWSGSIAVSAVLTAAAPVFSQAMNFDGQWRSIPVGKLGFCCNYWRPLYVYMLRTSVINGLVDKISENICHGQEKIVAENDGNTEPIDQ